MGAGAGCDITIKDCKVNSVDDINLQNATLEVDGWNVTITLDCAVHMDGTVNVASYYDGSGDIEEVALTVTNISLGLDFGSGEDDDILTAEAIDRFENQFDDDINSLWEDFLPLLTVNDIDPEYLKRELSSGENYTGTGKIGGGWTGFTFEGQMEIDDVDSRSGYNPVGGYTCSIDEQFVIDYIDAAKYGDNQEYTAYYNNDILDTYTTEEEAITALKQEILANIPAADLSNCQVERTYYWLRNGNVDNFEYESDVDAGVVVYSADNDPDFNFEGVAEAIEELNEEDDVGVDEGFDM